MIWFYIVTVLLIISNLIPFSNKILKYRLPGKKAMSLVLSVNTGWRCTWAWHLQPHPTLAWPTRKLIESNLSSNSLSREFPEFAAASTLKGGPVTFFFFFFFFNSVACPDVTWEPDLGIEVFPPWTRQKGYSYIGRGGEYWWEFKATNCFLMDFSPGIN